MTAIGDLCSVIRGWVNFEYDDALITSWTRMAEELISTVLRCKHMIQIDTGVVRNGRVLLPTDWLELDFVRDLDFNRPLTYRERTQFYSNPDPLDANYNIGRYTLSGNFLMTNPVEETDGRNIELTYYQAIPPLGDDINWLMQYYSRLYVTATLSVATMYSIEDDRAATWQAAMQTFIDSINEEHIKSKTSGGLLILPGKTKKKGFG